MATTRTTKEAAQMIGVSVGTIRNWSDQYAAFLGESARPGATPERRFTEKDVTILSYIKTLRDEGMQAEQIRQRLGETTFQDVEIIQQQATTEAPKPQQTAIEAHQGPQLPAVVVEDLHALETRLTAVEHAQRPNLWWFAAGLIVGLGAAVVAELFALIARR